MPYVKRTAAGRISAVFDRPSRDAKERVRANDPELLKFLGLAPTQSVDTPPVDAVLESYDSVEPQIDDPYVPPPAYDDALYDESQEFVNVGEDSAAAFEPAPAPNVPLEQEATNEDVGTEFSLPDDIPHDSFENDEFSGGFDLEGVDSAHTRSNDRAASEIAEASEAEAPVFESGDIPSGTSSPETAPPQSAPATTKPEAPPPPAQPETNITDDGSEASGNIDGTALRQLDASDLEMARITEDLIDLLIGRNIINFTDFPGMAQAKLINRRALRSNMSALTNLVGDEENIF